MCIWLEKIVMNRIKLMCRISTSMDGCDGRRLTLFRKPVAFFCRLIRNSTAFTDPPEVAPYELLSAMAVELYEHEQRCRVESVKCSVTHT